MTPWVTPAKEIQTDVHKEPTGTPNEQTAEEKLAEFERRHKEASDALSQKSEENIKDKIKIATLDPKSIAGMDKKMQNKVISDIYWYNNIEELKLIQWEEFWKSGEDQELTDSEELTRKVKMLELKNRQSTTTQAIKDFLRDNKKILKDDDGAYEKIAEELPLISESLSAEERVEKAVRILYWDPKNYVDNTTNTYLSMQEQGMSAWANAQAWTPPKENLFADFARASGFLKKD